MATLAKARRSRVSCVEGQRADVRLKDNGHNFFLGSVVVYKCLAASGLEFLLT